MNGRRCVEYEKSDGTFQEVKASRNVVYLGVKINSSLSFGNWCRDVAAEVRRRRIFVRRVIATGHLGRRSAEILYQGYVRGFINYGLEISSQCKLFSEIESADMQGQRELVGLLRTVSRIKTEHESNLTPLRTIALRARMRFVCKVPLMGRKYFWNGAVTRLQPDTFLANMIDEHKALGFEDCHEMEELREQLDEIVPKKPLVEWK